ncbi:hypothetical protein AbraIFM66950_003259 [Aspergillus brasiliensis]|nr:hypothetical protein AbraIFM66950_003259 [Aspergillus brasiliensis]
MSQGAERNSCLAGPVFTYTELPPESPRPTTRMIRLLPNEDRNAEIECEIFNYDFALDTIDGDPHIYEALSYVWGSGTRSQKITLNGCQFPVTDNLYVALSYLRNRQLDRVLWVDAVCIDQNNLDEKAKQIPLMRTIYAKAQNVIVWLGEAYDDGDKALEGLRRLAEEQDIDTDEYQGAFSKLLERPWFRRIWVLQEVGVAQLINIMCGPIQIKGNMFCEGLRKLSLSSRLEASVGPVAFLINGALCRPIYEPGSRGTLTIGELVSMYCSHDATEQHDKVYALLGLSADPVTAALKPNYNLPWEKVLKQVTSHIFPDCSVETWQGFDTAVIKGKGRILGHIYSVQKDREIFGHQNMNVYMNDTTRTPRFGGTYETWNLQALGQSPQDGDIVLHIQAKIGLEVRPKLIDMAPNYHEEPCEVEMRRNNVMRTIAIIALDALGDSNMESKVIENLLYESGTERPILEELVEAAANDRRSADVNFGDLPSPEEMARAVAECEGPSGYIILELLLQLQGESLFISEEIVKAAANNPGEFGYKAMEVLLRHRGECLPISEEVVKVAAENIGSHGRKILEVLFLHRGDSLPKPSYTKGERVSRSLKKWLEQQRAWRRRKREMELRRSLINKGKPTSIILE